MRDYKYERFIQNNPEAILVAKRKIHEDMHDGAWMYIYSYTWNGQYSYLFRYQDLMVTNPITFPIPIPHEELPLFCYEWFLEYITISGIEEMFASDGDFYHSPSHLNSWDFETKWRTRYGIEYGLTEGEGLREHRKKELLKHLEEFSKNASKEEKENLKKELEVYHHVLWKIGK